MSLGTEVGLDLGHIVLDAIWDTLSGEPRRNHLLNGVQIPTCEQAILRVK